MVETVGIVGRGVFLVDRRAQKLRYQLPYPAGDFTQGLPMRQAKKTKLLGYETFVRRVRDGDTVMFVARAPALNGDVVQIIRRFNGFNRVLEPLNIYPGQPRAAALDFPNYEVQN